MARALAQMIYESKVLAHIQDDLVRQDEEWYASRRLLLAEYEADFRNPTIKCLAAKACFELAPRDPELPSSERVLWRTEDGKFQVGRNFIYYLHDLARNEVNTWKVLRAVADERVVSISPEDVEGCMREELEELFQRHREEIVKP